jgi:hypothetical protein
MNAGAVFAFEATPKAIPVAPAAFITLRRVTPSLDGIFVTPDYTDTGKRAVLWVLSVSL